MSTYSDRSREIIDRLVREELEEIYANNERVVRDLLGRWVSELEPVICWSVEAPTQILGLGAPGHGVVVPVGVVR